MRHLQYPLRLTVPHDPNNIVYAVGLKALRIFHLLPSQMGNLCGKQSKDPFAGPGRTLGSAQPPPQRTTAPVPTQPKQQRENRGRTVGGTESSSDDPRAAAARAAEVRAKKSPGTGQLERKLDEQKKMTMAQVREQVARENQLARDADAAAEARTYN